MPVHFYVGRAEDGVQAPPDRTHELVAVRELATRLYRAFHKQEIPYAVIANVPRPSADLVVLSRHGIGVVELKGYPGPITAHADGFWMDGRGNRIDAGTAQQKPRLNPQRQVQDYADSLRARLRDTLQTLWKARPQTLDAMKVHTAVCFTNVEATMDEVGCKALGCDKSVRRAPWEKFAVLTPESLVNWAQSLRFEIKRPSSNTPYVLSEKDIRSLAESVLDSTRWTELQELLPRDKNPLASLVLLRDGQRVMTYAIKHERVRIGRSQTSDIVIPGEYGRVSNEHAEIRYAGDGNFYLRSLGSHGTSVEGSQIKGEYLLTNGTLLILGGMSADIAGTCTFEFVRDPTAVERVPTMQ